jgi:four helix bundle protein
LYKKELILKEENIVLNKSFAFAFAVKIVKTCQLLCKEKKEFILSKQLLRAGTSIVLMLKKQLEHLQEKILLIE